MKISSVIVLGGGSAGLITALTLKRKLPQLTIRVIRSTDIGVIGVGEGTTIAFPRHLFEYLRLSRIDGQRVGSTMNEQVHETTRC